MDQKQNDIIDFNFIFKNPWLVTSQANPVTIWISHVHRLEDQSKPDNHGKQTFVNLAYLYLTFCIVDRKQLLI